MAAIPQPWPTPIFLENANSLFQIPTSETSTLKYISPGASVKPQHYILQHIIPKQWQNSAFQCLQDDHDLILQNSPKNGGPGSNWVQNRDGPSEQFNQIGSRGEKKTKNPQFNFEPQFFSEP